jgi:hypothetical protein
MPEPTLANYCLIERTYLNNPTPKEPPMQPIAYYRDRFLNGDNKAIVEWARMMGFFSNMDEKEILKYKSIYPTTPTQYHTDNN